MEESGVYHWAGADYGISAHARHQRHREQPGGDAESRAQRRGVEVGLRRVAVREREPRHGEDGERHDERRHGGAQ